MKEKLKKKIVKHIEKDDKEFKGQIKDDKKLMKTIKSEKMSACCDAKKMKKK